MKKHNFNGVAGGSKSAFLKKVRTYFRDQEIKARSRYTGHSGVSLAGDYELTKQRIYQILKQTETIVSDPRYYWAWVAHYKALKAQHANEWIEFVNHWRDTDPPPQPHWFRRPR